MSDAQHITAGTGKVTAGTGDVTANAQPLTGTGEVVADVPGHHSKDQTGVPSAEQVKEAAGNVTGGTGNVTADIPGHKTS